MTASATRRDFAPYTDPFDDWCSITPTADGWLVVVVRDSLVVTNRTPFKQRVASWIEDRGYARVRIDLTRCGYIDHTGLGVLVSLRRKAVERGGDVTLVGLNEELRALFDVTKLDTVFTIGEAPDA